MSLDELRREIDRIDSQILRLLNKRAAAAVKIGRAKRKNRSPVRDPQREDMVLKRVKKLNNGPLSRKEIETIYRRIIAACIQLQKKM